MPRMQLAADAPKLLAHARCFKSLVGWGRTGSRHEHGREPTWGSPTTRCEIRAQGWRTLAALHGLIEVALERELQAAARAVRGGVHRAGRALAPGRLAHADAAAGPRGGPVAQRDHAPGQPARGPRAADADPVPDDRRGIYTELTRAGRELLDAARGRPTTRRCRRRWTRPARPLSWPGWPTRCTASHARQPAPAGS